jgi:hypothetical protein
MGKGLCYYDILGVPRSVAAAVLRDKQGLQENNDHLPLGILVCRNANDVDIKKA